ncbi:hypothetical protein KR200_010222 [Drosophila serrata]|nr:hypothetical protein KR200_010222 [Drosophila serrata]
MERMLNLKKPEQGTGLQVFLRLRPPHRQTVSTSYTVNKDGNELITKSVKYRLEKHFGFTSIFDSSVDQREVYERCVGPLVDAEEGLTIMMYGTSGSGKTYTLLGNDESIGIIPRALNHLFTNCRDRIQHIPIVKLIRGNITALQDYASQKELQVGQNVLDQCPALDSTTSFEDLGKVREKKEDGDEVVFFYISFMEIHNEVVYDLLAMPSQRFRKLNVVYNKGEVFVEGLSSVFVTNVEDALRLLQLGRQRSTCAATPVNDRSSRSHCVFTLDMLKFNRSGFTTRAAFKFCDLAGSERVRTTDSTGERLEETKNINTSLMVLGRCLDAACSLSQGSKHVVIPHRESKLTLLLHAALLGKEKLIMMVALQPVDNFYEENQNVLNFAAIAKNIVFPEAVTKQQVVSNCTGPLELAIVPVVSRDEVLKQLEEEHLLLVERVTSLKAQQAIHFQALMECKEFCKKELICAYLEVRFEAVALRRQLESEIKALMKRCENLMRQNNSSSDQDIK